MVQFFEMTFELAWNVLKDYLESQGFLEVKTPRTVLKRAFELELIDDGVLWLKALEDHNLMSQTYHEETSLEVEKKIREFYFPLLQKLQRIFKAL